MGKPKYIALTDADDTQFFVEEESLIKQLIGAKIPGSEPTKYAYRHFAAAVFEMRRLQKEYFSSRNDPKAKEWLLKKAKAAESKVDAILKRSQDIELL